LHLPLQKEHDTAAETFSLSAPLGLNRADPDPRGVTQRAYLHCDQPVIAHDASLSVQLFVPSTRRATTSKKDRIRSASRWRAFTDAARATQWKTLDRATL